MRYPGFLLLAAFAAILIALPLSADQSVGEDPDAELSQTEDLTYTDDSVGSRLSLNIISVQTSECDKSSGTGAAEVYLGGNVGIYSMKCIMIFNRDYFTPTGITSSGLMDMVDHDIHGNICMVELISPTKGANVTSAGLLFTVTYQADDDVPLGMHPVFIDVTSSASVGAPPRVEISSGIIFVSYPTGDVNGDGKVSLADSLAVRKAIAGQGSVDTMLSDLNNDGRTDSTDSLLLRKIIAGWDVGTTPAYDHGDGRAKVFIYDVVGIGYGPFHVFSTVMFEVQKAGVKTQFAHAAGDTYTFSLESGESLKIMNASSMGASERAVIYELNGGNLDWSMPVAYMSGGKTDLGCPTNDDGDLYFIGWFTDEECTESILYIPADATGTVTVYALWDDTLVGHGFTMDYARIDMTGGSENPLIAEYQRSFWAIGADGIYLVCDSWDYGNKRIDNEKEVGWKTVLPGDMTDNGIMDVDIDGWNVSAHCFSSVSDDRSEMCISFYIYDWLMVVGVYYHGDSQTAHSLTIAGIDNFEAEDQYSVSVFTEGEVTVSNLYEEVPVGGSVTLSACDGGDGFRGWYDIEGNLLSKEYTYTVSNVISDTVLIAASDNLYDYSYDRGEKATFYTMDDEAVWTLVDQDSMTVLSQSVGSSFSFEFDSYGYYELFITGDFFGLYNEVLFILVDVEIFFLYPWESDHSPICLNMMYSDYWMYSHDDIERWPGADFTLGYVTYDDPTVTALAKKMKANTNGMDDNDVLDYVLEFVQVAIPYDDDEGYGWYDYWRYPVETLYERTGDCEDTSILYCATAKAMGYDVALMLFHDHMAAGVNIKELGWSNGDVKYQSINGKKNYYIENDGDIIYVYKDDKTSNYYFWCETTGSGYNIGDGYYDIEENPKDDPYSSYNAIHVKRIV